MNSPSVETVQPPAAGKGPAAHVQRPGPPGGGTPNVWRYTVLAVCLALFVGLGYWRMGTRARLQAELATAAPSASETPVAVVRAQRSDASQNVTFPGNVQAYVETPIYARTAGYLTKWYVDIGGRVQAGQLLALIDTPEVNQQLRQAEAAQLQAEANLDLAKTTAERWQNLLKSDGVSQQEVDQNVSAYKARQADLQAAAANVDRLKYLQSFQSVTAPFSGVITARNVDIGALIADGNSQQLFKLAQIDVLRVYVNVPEPYGNDMVPGIPAELRVAEFVNRTFVGKVVRTAGAIDPASRTLLSEVDVPNPKGEIMPGAYAEVAFHLHGGAQPLIIPSNTLIFRSAGSQVAIVENSHARLRSVTIGRDLGSEPGNCLRTARQRRGHREPAGFTERWPARRRTEGPAGTDRIASGYWCRSLARMPRNRPMGHGAPEAWIRQTLRSVMPAAVILLAGCRSVGPIYDRPAAETPAAWKEQPPEGWKNATPSDNIAKGNWWEIFGDPQLNDLETQAIAANQNLKAAVQRVLEARANSKATRANLYPSVSANPSVSHARISGTASGTTRKPGAPYSANTISLPIDASYEVDLWGQIRRSIESANALTQVSVADYENVLLALKSDVAEYYVMLHYIDQERAILRDNIDLQQKALDLAQVRHDGGVASGLDVSEAETLLDTTQGDYAGLGVQRAQFEHALAVLVGRPPAEFAAPEKALDLKPPVIPPGLPSDLLERRPDVAAAERTMDSNNALIGVARAAYFPNVALTGSGGLLSADLTQLFTVPSLVWTAAAGAVQPLYTGGRLSAGMEHARAVYEESVDNYREQVLTAFQEVEDGLSGLRVLEEQAAAYDKAVQSAQKTVDISTSRYREGLAEYIEVITAESSLLANERAADQILEQRLLTTIQLIQALGGGWQDSRIYSSSPGAAGTSEGPSSPPPSATPGERPH